ncbi:MAG: hypothetical protein WCB14_10605 [Candidatus Acidiferrales bacterium]
MNFYEMRGSEARRIASGREIMAGVSVGSTRGGRSEENSGLERWGVEVADVFDGGTVAGGASPAPTKKKRKNSDD